MNRFAWSLVCTLALSGCPDPNPPAPAFDFSGVEGFQFDDGGNPLDLSTSDGDAGPPADLMLPPLDGPMLNTDGSTIDPAGPAIVIQSPAANAEVKGNTLTVRASIIAGIGKNLVADSIKLAVPTPAGGSSESVMSFTGMPNIYEGVADISMLSGSANASVTARDNTGHSNTAFVSFGIDKGPQITFKQPLAATAKGSVSVEVEVLDLRHPVAMNAVKMTVRPGDNLMFTVTDMSPMAGMAPYFYRALTTINFNDPQYDPPLDGPQLITVEATNSNSTKGTATKQFTVDNAGPAIVITSPKAGEFVGGVIDVKAQITDISAIVPSSVVAVFANDPVNHKITLVQSVPGGSEYHGPFDVRGLDPASVLPSVSVRADDVLGNHGEFAHEIIVDTTRLSMEMDPPHLRLRKPAPDVGFDCSALFDPLGPETANDGDIVNQIITLRARIEDHGNIAAGLLVERLSGIDTSSVRLFVVPAVGNTSLNVDTDGDGMCDDINPNLLPTPQVTMSGQALSLGMVEIPTNGLADFKGSNPKPPSPAPWDSLGCNFEGDSSPTSPVPLCPSAGTGLTVAIQRFGDLANPIWTLPPVNASPSGCVGFQLDSLNTLPEGPTCVAVRAKDKAGNVNVSPPLRICIKRGTATACNGWGPSTLPDCTGTYNKGTGIVNDAINCVPFDSAATIVGGPYNGMPVFQTRFRRNPLFPNGTPVQQAYEVRNTNN